MWREEQRVTRIERRNLPVANEQRPLEVRQWLQANAARVVLSVGRQSRPFAAHFMQVHYSGSAERKTAIGICYSPGHETGGTSPCAHQD